MSDFPDICGCITCGDQGIEMVVIACDSDTRLAKAIASGGAVSEVDTGLLDTVDVGARLMVHAGTAIAVLDAQAVSA